MGTGGCQLSPGNCLVAAEFLYVGEQQDCGERPERPGDCEAPTPDDDGHDETCDHGDRDDEHDYTHEVADEVTARGCFDAEDDQRPQQHRRENRQRAIGKSRKPESNEQ